MRSVQELIDTAVKPSLTLTRYLDIAQHAATAGQWEAAAFWLHKCMYEYPPGEWVSSCIILADHFASKAVQAQLLGNRKEIS